MNFLKGLSKLVLNWEIFIQIWIHFVLLRVTLKVSLCNKFGWCDILGIKLMCIIYLVIEDALGHY